jgi:hypothetical protein
MLLKLMIEQPYLNPDSRVLSSKMVMQRLIHSFMPTEFRHFGVLSLVLVLPATGLKMIVRRLGTLKWSNMT